MWGERAAPIAILFILSMLVLTIHFETTFAALPTFSCVGKVIEKDVEANTFKIQADYCGWQTNKTIFEYYFPNEDARNGVDVGDYVMVSSIGTPYEPFPLPSIFIGKMVSDGEKVITDMYGDPSYFYDFAYYPKEFHPSILGNYTITYNNEPNCSNCTICNCEAAYSNVTINRSGQIVDNRVLYPGQSYTYEGAGYSISITFHHGEAAARPKCANQLCFGPQPFSDFTIHISEAGVTPSIPKTIYVDDDFVDDPQNHKWNTIQEGVNDANDGDVILVYPGSYIENVNVNRSVTIKSISGNPEDTIVRAANSNAPVFNVTADQVNISGFTISGTFNRGVEIFEVDFCNISGNKITGNRVGIYLQGSAHSIIADNNASFNVELGIYLFESDSNKIINNIVDSNDWAGIRLESSSYNELTGNNASNNRESGIALVLSEKNIIEKNNLTLNNGVGAWGGIYLFNSSQNKIRFNNIEKNVNGIYMELACNDNEIYLNNFIGNGKGANSSAQEVNNIWSSPSPITYTYNSETYTNYLGNYWSDYDGSDLNNDGIGDTPYTIDSNNKDSYPLMQPFENYFAPTGNKPPVASFTFSPLSPVVNQPVTFNASSSYDPDGYIVSYQWDFGDGSTSSGVKVQHAYSSLGSYEVTLTVTDDDGATDSISKTLQVGSTRANPTVTLTPSPQIGIPGSTLTYKVSVKNNDPSSLGPSTFSLTYSVPSGWSASLGKTSVTLNPGETDSSITLSVTSPPTASIGKYVISVTAENIKDKSVLGTGDAVFAIGTPLATKLLSKAIQALDSQKDGVLEGAIIVDNNIPNIPLKILADSIGLIPLPIPAKGRTKRIIGYIVKKAVGIGLEQLTPHIKGKIHDVYLKGGFPESIEGGFPESIESAKQKIREIATDKNILNLREGHPFIQDMLNYFDYISEVGSDYEDQIQSLVAAHNNQKILKEIYFAMAGFSIIVLGPGAGLSGPIIDASTTGLGGAKTVLDLSDENNFKQALVFTSEQQYVNAYYFKEAIISAFAYIRDRANKPQSFPKISINPPTINIPSIGDVSLSAISQNGDIDFTIKNEAGEPLMLKIVTNAKAIIPSLLYRPQTYIVPQIAYGNISKGIMLAGKSKEDIHIDADIDDWLNDVASKLAPDQRISISYIVKIKVFYGEDYFIALKEEFYSSAVFIQAKQSIKVPLWVTQERTGPLWLTQTPVTAITLNEEQHKLYLHVYDQYNRSVGLNTTTGEIEVNIPGATYEDQGNRIVVTLPANITSFTYSVDAQKAEYQNEKYQVYIATLRKGKVLAYAIEKGNITKGDIHESLCEISPDAKEIRVNKTKAPPNSVVIYTSSQPLGDVNGDNQVDYKDLAIMVSSYGKERGDPGFNPSADLNNDGVIDYRDLAIVVSNYGKEG